MQGEQHPTRVLLRKTRERVIEQLSEAFSKDRISLDEFEKRVDDAYAQTTSGELVALVSDLGPLESVTELFVRAVFGNIEITVAPTVAVECEGVGFLGEC